MRRYFMLVFTLVLLLLGLLLPFIIIKFTGKTYWIIVFTEATYFALFTLSLDVFSGTTGYLNLGHQLFIGLGALLSGYISLNYGFPPLLSVTISAIISGIAGLALFLPSLRVRGFYFALLTFFTPMIFLYLFSAYPLNLYFGGEGGLSVKHYLYGIVPQRILLNNIYRPLLDYYVPLLLLILFIIFSYKLTFYTSFGISLRSIGQDEELARASGIKVNRIKAIALFISAFMAGFTGALYGHYIGVITTEFFSPLTFLVPILAIWIVGGPGSIAGSVFASYLLIPLEEFLRPLVGEYRVMLYMAILLFLIILKPTGLISWLILKIRGIKSGTS